MKAIRTGIAKNIFDLMHDHEPPMTAKELAQKSGVGQSKLESVLSDSRDKTGNKRLPNSDELFMLAAALDVTPYKLLTGIDDINHVACEELGLSNDSVNTLWACSHAFGQGIFPRVPKVIDILLQEKSFEFIRILYAFIVDGFEYVHVLNEQKSTDGKKEYDKIPTESVAGLTKEQLERTAAFQMVEYALKLRADYQKKQAEKAADSE